MRAGSLLFRISASLATAGILAVPCWTAPALAQRAPGPPIRAATAVDPPERVGRLAAITGTVSFHTTDQENWSPATLNYPLTTGDALWTEPEARASVEVGGSLVALDGGTDFQIDELTPTSLAATLAQGQIYVNLQHMAAGDSVVIRTSRAVARIDKPGRYVIAAGNADSPTIMGAVDGAIQVTGENITLQVGAGQMATLQGKDPVEGAVGPLDRSPFLQDALAREAKAARAVAALPAPVRHMTGAASLAATGAWRHNPEYGEVWYPEVAADWAPYRDGRWAYVAPWGWTWMDNAPWGFAPFHYGRWARVEDRWGWVPGLPGVPIVARPVYAPALVRFAEVGAAALAGAAIGFAAGRIAGGRGPGNGGVAWVPLAPNEPYYPPYRASRTYLRQVNVRNVTNINTVTVNNVTVVRPGVGQTGVGQPGQGRPGAPVFAGLANQAAGTVMPAAAMVRSYPVQQASRPLPPAMAEQARAVVGRPPIAPAPVSFGVTPQVARRYGYAPQAFPARPPAPGPAFARPGGGPGRNRNTGRRCGSRAGRRSGRVIGAGAQPAGARPCTSTPGRGTDAPCWTWPRPPPCPPRASRRSRSACPEASRAARDGTAHAQPAAAARAARPPLRSARGRAQLPAAADASTSDAAGASAAHAAAARDAPGPRFRPGRAACPSAASGASSRRPQSSIAQEIRFPGAAGSGA